MTTKKNVSQGEAKPAKRKGGTPAHIPTDEIREKIKQLSEAGFTHAQIANNIGINKLTLYKYYRKTLDTAKIDQINSVAQTLIQQAKNGSVAAAIFFLKSQGQWTDVTVEDLELKRLEARKKRLEIKQMEEAAKQFDESDKPVSRMEIVIVEPNSNNNPN